MAKSLLEHIREAHQDCLKGVDGGTGGARAAPASKGKGSAAGGGGGGGGGAPSSAAAAAPSTGWYEADALALVPLFAEHASSTGEMNFLNKTSGAMSLAADVAGIASSIGQEGSLAGFLRDLGHTCCSSTASLRQAIRVSDESDLELIQRTFLVGRQVGRWAIRVRDESELELIQKRRF